MLPLSAHKCSELDSQVKLLINKTLWQRKMILLLILPQFKIRRRSIQMRRNDREAADIKAKLAAIEKTGSFILV